MSKQGRIDRLTEDLNFNTEYNTWYEYDRKILARKLIEKNYRKVIYGKWTGMDGDRCSVCGRHLSDIMDADSFYAIGFDIKEIVACPFCGAIMEDDDE